MRDKKKTIYKVYWITQIPSLTKEIMARFVNIQDAIDYCQRMNRRFGSKSNPELDGFYEVREE